MPASKIIGNRVVLALLSFSLAYLCLLAVRADKLIQVWIHGEWYPTLLGWFTATALVSFILWLRAVDLQKAKLPKLILWGAGLGYIVGYFSFLAGGWAKTGTFAVSYFLDVGEPSGILYLFVPPFVSLTWLVGALVGLWAYLLTRWALPTGRGQKEC
jgi:hypothetical protein